ncbi:MAG: hypothetical protein HQL22_09700 [Candidatus Omnitrophica bacterium]|nr:hypothetical protein [Candidatus Omnitrophota bacterium]
MSYLGGLQDVFRNPTNAFKEEVLTYGAFLKEASIEEFQTCFISQAS